MDITTAAVLAGLTGVVVGALAVAVWRLGERPPRDEPTTRDSVLSPGMVEVLEALRVPSVVVGPDDVVVRATAAAHVLGLLRNDRVFPADLAALVASVRSDQRPRDHEVVREPSLRDEKGLRTIEIHLTPLSRGLVLMIAEDVTEARRLDTVRRDFVANVSHELKTPTGALALLAEAITDAADDPQAVKRFAGRMNHEANRLAGLITELIDLTRVQDSGPLREPVEVRLDAVVAEAVDVARMPADARRITVSIGGTPGLQTYGDHDQLVTALKNLVVNAVSYSPEGTRVAVATRESGDHVEITVTDQGIGIPDADLDRVFERFYRVDPARSRQTGGTGLGLSIVKHVIANHGGEISVWSVEGEGSTFTMRFPRKASPAVRRDAHGPTSVDNIGDPLAAEGTRFAPLLTSRVQNPAADALPTFEGNSR